MMTPMFTPPQWTMNFWHEVVKPLITREELRLVMDYVERTWIGKAVDCQVASDVYDSCSGTPTQLAADRSIIARGRKPLFPVELSNQYTATVEGRPRHNDHMESNNAKLKRLIKPNPSAWDFFISLRAAYRGDFQLLYNVRI